MSDEKTTIYISPEDDLTSLRERLEKIPARSITLVIPTQSQLRSHVAWKLLHARSRELGKDILVVSSDPQIRSVALSVKFRVANSLESPSSGRSRPTSRSGRSILGNRGRPTGSTQRPAKNSGQGTDSLRPRQPEPTEQWSPATDRTLQPAEDNALGDGVVTGNISDIDPSIFADDRYDVPGEQAPYNFPMNSSPSIHPLSQQQIDEEPDMWLDDYKQAQHIRERASQMGSKAAEPSPQPDAHEAYDHYSGGMTTPAQESPSEDALYNYRVTPLPGVGEDPLGSMDDVFYPPLAEQRGSVPAIEGFGTSEHAIRDVSAQPGEVRHDIEYDGDQDNFAQYSDTPLAPQPPPDPIAEDDQDRAGPSPFRRMRPRSGRAGRRSTSSPVSPISPLVPRRDYDNDDALPPVADRPTQITPMMPPATPAASGTFTTPRSSRSLQPGSRASGNLPPNQIPRTSGNLPPNQAPRASGNLPPNQIPRVSGTMSPRASGTMVPNQAPRVSGNLPPNQMPRVSGTMSPRASGAMSPNQSPRVSGAMSPNQAPRVSSSLPTGPVPPVGRNPVLRQAPVSPSGNMATRNRPALSKPVPRQSRTGRSAPMRQGPLSRANARSAARRRRSIGMLVLVACILLFLALVMAAYLLPTAQVTVTLPARNYSAPVKLLASPTNASNPAAGTIPAETLQKVFTTSGTGKATGSTKIGTAPAKGIVFFSNNGNQQVVIPSNVIVTTSNGTQFVTQAEVSIGPKGSALNCLPTTIQAQSSGDTGNVPAGSITSIPPASLSTIAQYNNAQVADLNLKVTNDAATSGGGAGTATTVTQNDLNNTQTTLSAQLQDEITTWTQQQLSTGDVAGKPAITPTLTKAPKVNDIEQSGTFPATLTQSVQVPVVRNATLQSATVAQLNAALSKDAHYQNYQIMPDQANAVQIPQFTPISNGLSMTLSFKPTGKIIPKIPDVRSRLVGKTNAEAVAMLQEIIPNVQKVDVKVSPGIDPWLPLRSGQINVKYVAGSVLPSNVKLPTGP